MRATAAAVFGFVTLLATAARGGEPELPSPLTREALVRAVVARDPEVQAQRERAAAEESAARAAGSLPAPELMAQLWSVPLARPLAVGDASMMMVGIAQAVPAPGSRSAMEAAGVKSAEAQRAALRSRARRVAQSAGHAYATYAEAAERHALHQRHLTVTSRIADVAARLHAAGGSLRDATRARLAVVKVRADLVDDGARVESARATLNALLGREADAPLPEPAREAPRTATMPTRDVVIRAREERPEVAAAKLESEASRLREKAAAREATWPSFSIAALYFAPVGMENHHGYGANASISLPWLWGPAAHRRDAAAAMTRASAKSALAMRLEADSDAARANAEVRAATARLAALESELLPEARRARDVALASVDGGDGSIVDVLDAEQMLLDAEMDLAEARVRLEHALTDLDAAVGAPVARAPVPSLAPSRARP
jgi:cobalt-zinc-cadmium efflux system outer membrane protein